MISSKKVFSWSRHPSHLFSVRACFFGFPGSLVSSWIKTGVAKHCLFVHPSQLNCHEEGNWAECDGTQNFFRYRDRYFFPGPNFSGTGTGTFFRDQIFPVPVPVLFSGTNFFRYRYRYFFPGPIFSGTGTGTIQKKGEFPGPGQNRYHMGLFKRLRY